MLDFAISKSFLANISDTKKFLPFDRNEGRLFNNSQIDTLIAKRLSAENKAKLFELEPQTRAHFVIDQPAGLFT